MNDISGSDFITLWFEIEPVRMLETGCVVLSEEESESFHREALSWSASVWGQYAFYREVVPLIMRGEKEYFGTVRSFPEDEAPVFWIDVARDVCAAVDLNWTQLVHQLSNWDDSLAPLFPPHFHNRDLGNTSFVKYF